MRVLPVLLLCGALAGCRHAALPDTAAIAPQPAPAAFAHAEADIATLQAQMARGTLDSAGLTAAYLQRIDALDRRGPALHAIIERNPQAMDDARRLDAERRAGHLRGPLHGIPLVLKDNIDARPMANSAGSLALAEFHPPHDAFLVQRLRQAGAVILGKSNLSEWANFRASKSSSGWSARGGQTRNPYVLDRNPCGSSAGTGVAVSANLVAAGIGTETDGSIVCPAAVNGLVGLKPTVGLVSRDGIIPISASQDTAGPMTRSVADAAALLSVLAAPDPADPATAAAPRAPGYDYAAHLRRDALRGARIGLLPSPLTQTPDIAAAQARAVATLRAAGAIVVDAQIPTAGQWDDAELTVLLTEFKAGLERYLDSRKAPLRTLAQLIEFNRAHAARELAAFDQALFEQAQATRGLDDPAYLQAREKAKRLAGPDGIDAALRAQRLDALIAPTTGRAWKTDPIGGDDFPGASYGAAAVAGYPSLTVPMGSSDGLPLGLVFIGSAWSEPRLIELGYAYEQRSRARTPPTFLPTLPAQAQAARAADDR
ncbi:amidase [Xanthomonas sp. NCPPB 2654]|uniref:amidase n=1 Tax=unclassified Xanthomonas TaxID=2643310 RepID=UPI0021E09CF2|nr:MULTISPECIES: amidase [unclassified Xanthomonas]MDL5368169.1 amidase [Xanthomonas sp. NCPPB 2654]UYC21775.1 amidase [Xanthomonas sp. CFBP 8443]